MTPTHTRGMSTVLIAAAIMGCGGTTPATVMTSPSPQAAAGSQGNPAAIAKAKADSARYPYTQADVHFMSGMISHHAQAIVMARWAPTHGASGSVSTLCARIINAQTDEIALMQQWLRDRHQTVPEPRATGMKTVMDGVEHEMLMPGMLTEAQLKQLDDARGAEFDRLFLIFMIQHHNGAVSMVQDLFAAYGAAQDETVFKFASDVNVDQSTEIARMQKMLVTLAFEKRSP